MNTSQLSNQPPTVFLTPMVQGLGVGTTATVSATGVQVANITEQLKGLSI